MAERKGNVAGDVRENRAELARTFSRGEYFWYATTRGLHNFENGVDQGYLSYLPSFEGHNFEAIIDNLITQQSPNSVNILDVGCGTGNFLGECLEKWGKNVMGFGVDLKSGTRDGNLDIKLSDVHNLGRLFPANSMDVVTSVRTLEYTADPWSVVKRIHRVLKPGGIALLSYIPFRMNKLSGWRENKFDAKGAKYLVDYLNTRYDMETQVVDDEYCNLSFRKTTDKLWLPLSYGNTIFHRERILAGLDTLQYTTLGYKFRSYRRKNLLDRLG